MTDDARPAATRPTWIWGGALLIASAVTGSTLAGSGVPFIEVVGSALFAASMICFAWGRDSIVARRPLGMTALVVLAIWPFVSAVTGPLLWGDVAVSGEWDYALLTVLGYVSILIPAVAAVIAAVQVMRIGVLDQWARWIPLAAVGSLIAVGVLTQLAYTAMPLIASLPIAIGVAALSSLLQVLVAIGLGVVGIVAGQRRASSPAAHPAHAKVTDG